MRLYIQKVKLKINGIESLEFPNDLTFTAFIGAQQKGSDDEIIFFEEIEEVPKGKDVYGYPYMVITFIEKTIQYLQYCKIDPSIYASIDIPDELKHLTGRNFEYKTLKQFKQETNLPIFVKSHSKIKAFPSGVISEQSSRKELFNKDQEGKELDDEMIVMTSEVVDIVSEYRCFVLNGELMEIKHYQGDFRLFPYIDVIQRMIKEYKSAPIAYTLDVGILINQKDFLLKTILIEVNDMWAVGPYGVDPSLYLKLLKRRWLQIFKVIK